ncbi:hypothetical protein ACQEVM_37435 [Streptomyces sp. CA-243310]|uniref:hypothetical protein n=1 Tax=Streptomyces sp. CA-243310 TaxID=3240056 RepID=UPI003D8A5DDB
MPAVVVVHAGRGAGLGLFLGFGAAALVLAFGEFPRGQRPFEFGAQCGRGHLDAGGGLRARIAASTAPPA